MQKNLLLIFCCFLFCYATAQDVAQVRAYEQKITASRNDAEKIDAICELAEYYSIFNLQSKADSILQKALFIAEISSDKELVLKILFNNTVTSLSPWSSKETFEHSRNFIIKGLQYAQDLKRDGYVAIAYTRLAGIYRKRHEFDEAAQQATLAMTALGNAKADSLACALYIEFGDIYIAKGDAVPAFKNYNTAFEIAYKQKNITLQCKIYHRFSELYNGFGDTVTAKKYLLQSLRLNTDKNDASGKFLDCIDLARITNERDYIDKARLLAEELNNERYKLTAKRLLYYWYMVAGKNSSQTFNFLYSNTDLVQFFKNSGPAIYAREIGNIYYYSSNYDSALVYLIKAENEIKKTNNPSSESYISITIAEAYLRNHDTLEAKNYFEKAFVLSKQLNRLKDIDSVCSQLKILYAKNANYKQAYYYSSQADSVNKILESNVAKDKVVLLQVEQENKKRETDIAEAAQEEQRKHNLQIMAITVLLTVIFVLMLFVGTMPISKTAIKLIGYFAFISLFEFIILLLDHPIISFTNGEPIKIWAIKILLITILVPCQHFMESRLIRFLQSRKLLEVRQKFSFKNWWARVKKTPTVNNAGIEKLEDDTAVL